ncbi:putative nucleosome assembly protein C36B7.08c [Sclerotinia borealis F-4128]|uniref:Putative nucleosome assembly protein C36B7.08c n=1 Tax=Sclerotinia borealis (strain F-4128) TaxID=1432307 RepID=W9CBK9_SCLBF|nr:putative nucleosome assembly protein C36B7.08c [Sclerotinia borealis F-4128]
MAAALEDTPVCYEDLAEIERDFDDAETEIIRLQVSLTRPLYTRRNNTVAQIPNFWALVLEQAPPDIDQYIQPSDSALLLSSLTSLHVSHFELENPKTAIGGDPRSVSITWTFSSNEYFEDEKLVKKFWYRKSVGGWCGLVSEPVRINWKKGKDLTGGLLGMVSDAWDAEQRGKKNREKDGKSKDMSPQQKALEKKMANTSMGGLSFFAWFGFIGRRVSEEESKETNAKDLAKRKARKNGEKVAESEDEDDEKDDEEDLGMSLEIFPDGDDLAIAITEDLWPGAIKYFTAAQEQDALSDADFESDDEEDDDELTEVERPVKKQKSS